MISFISTRLAGKKRFDEMRQQAQGDDAPAPEKVEKAEDITLSEVAQLKTRLRPPLRLSGGIKFVC